jgi:hypothetical protein
MVQYLFSKYEALNSNPSTGVVHTYYISYTGGRDREDHGMRQPKQKFSKTPISTSKLGMVVCACNTNYMEV